MPKHNAITSSPFRYVGGKYYARKSIIARIPEHQIYIEPFCGGASIFFAKPKADLNWLNDIDADLIQTLVSIRDNPAELAALVRDFKVSREQHEFFKKSFQPSNELEVAARWFYLNRTSYSGIMNKKNCYFSYNPLYTKPQQRWTDLIMAASEKLQDVRLTSLDFSALIHAVPNHAFLFIDPPHYMSQKDKLYSYDMSPLEHQRMADQLRRLKDRENSSFLLCYDDCKPVRQLYPWASIDASQQWERKINRSDYDAVGHGKGTRKESELLISPQPVLAEAEY